MGPLGTRPEVSFTADWWRIEQKNVVGIFGDDNHILLDYVLRENGGSNPAVVRATPDAQDILDFQGTGLSPVGDILYVDDNYLNLDERTVQGWDFGLYYNLDDTPIGDFSFKLNAALLAESAVVFWRVLSAVQEKELRAQYRKVVGGLLRRRASPQLMQTYAMKTAMHYHVHKLVASMEGGNVVNPF